MNMGNIIVHSGNIQGSFKDGGYYSEKACNLIEDIVACDKAKLSENGGSGRIRFTDNNGNMVVQLSIVKDRSFISDEGKSIVVIRSKRGSISSNAYYGVDAELDLVPGEKECSSDPVDLVKHFYKSYRASKGEISVVVIIVDDKRTFDSITKDSLFENCYVLLAE